MNFYRGFAFIAVAGVLAAQPVSSYRYSVKGDQKTVEITNVNYEVTYSGLVLRTTAKSKHVIGDIGEEATTTVEAWKLGTDLKSKPLYAVTAEGSESRTVDHELFVIARGLEDTEWWSVYRMANGAHLFDTHVPLVAVNINRASLTMRYMGLEVPEDDAKDPRLKDSHVVGVLSYASSEKVIREVLITCDDPKQAQLLRSYADESRSLSADSAVHISLSQNFPSPPATLNLAIPIVRDDLDLAHAQLPAKMHAAVWKR